MTRWWLPALAAAGLLIGIFLWSGYFKAPEANRVAQQASSPALPPASLAAEPEPALQAASQPPSSPPPPDAPASAAAPGKMQVCGRGLLDAAEAESAERQAAWTAEWTKSAELLKARVRQQLQASANDADKVSALLLDGDLTAAAELARHSEDGRAYALAMSHCASKRGSGSCEFLNAARWAQIEPDNAAAWLAVGEAARQRGDEPGFLEALHRASLATRVDMGFGQLAGRISDSLAALDVEAGEGPMAALVVEAMGRDAGASTWAVAGAARACSTEANRDSNRRQTCQALARVLMSQGRTLLDIGMGLRIGERAGLPLQELAPLRAEMAAAQKLQHESLIGPPDRRFSCESFKRMRTYMAEVGTQGEWATMRVRLAASKKKKPGV